MIRTIILTISSTRTKENDASGKKIRELLKAGQYEICGHEIIKDNTEEIKKRLIHHSEEGRVDLILTTGGTGFGPMDVTPEAALEVIEKQSPGISELIRSEGFKKTYKAVLSRGVSGIRNNTLIINLPGSPKGAGESLEIILNIIPHAIDMIKGKEH